MLIAFSIAHYAHLIQALASTRQGGATNRRYLGWAPWLEFSRLLLAGLSLVGCLCLSSFVSCAYRCPSALSVCALSCCREGPSGLHFAFDGAAASAMKCRIPHCFSIANMYLRTMCLPLVCEPLWRPFFHQLVFNNSIFFNLFFLLGRLLEACY